MQRNGSGDGKAFCSGVNQENGEVKTERMESLFSSVAFFASVVLPSLKLQCQPE